MTGPIVLTARDFEPLLADPNYMGGLIDALERAILVEHEGRVRQGSLADEGAGDSAGSSLRLNLLAGDAGLASVSAAGTTAAGNSRFVMLFDDATRGLATLIDPSPFNPVRVGAEGGLGARHLAPPGAKVMGMLGSSKQARTQMAALCHELPDLETIKVYSPTREHRESFCTEMSSWLGRRIEPVESVEEALRDADVVDLVNNARRPLFELSQFKPGSLVLTITGRGELPDEFMTGTRVIAPVWSIFSTSQVRDPFTTAIKAGRFTREDFGAELGAVIAGKAPARLAPSDIVDFEATAVPVLEHATLAWAYEWAVKAGAGTPLSLS